MSNRLLERMRTRLRRLPKNPEELRDHWLYNQWWYYSVELLPDVVTKGIYPASFPLLPRIMMRRCELEGASCLDLGSMEGLMPVLMRRGGAKEVLATDAIDHCVEKMEAVRRYYQADFDYKSVGLMYNLSQKLGGRGFDFINCSGLLYHVFSPLMVLSGIRPLLKRNGLMVVSTNVLLDDSFSMDFNNAGRMQTEANTFWYISIGLLDYLLRYLRLAPNDCICVPHSQISSDRRYVFDKPSGYVSVLCRAVDTALATADDPWMASSVSGSWEYKDIPDWKLAESQPVSRMKYKGQVNQQIVRPELECIDLSKAIKQSDSLISVVMESDSHTLRLSDRS